MKIFNICLLVLYNFNLKVFSILGFGGRGGTGNNRGAGQQQRGGNGGPNKFRGK